VYPPPVAREKKSLSAIDRGFLAWEGRDVMMHVGSLLQFSPPAEGGPASAKDIARSLREEIARGPKVESPWNLKLRHPDLLTSPLQAWVEDDSFDVAYHLRRSALASPGDERELGVLVSRLHGTPLDFHRPPWEAHLIEGLEGGRLAMYFKVHHALIDGYTGMRLLIRSFSADPSEASTPLFFSRPPIASKRRPDEAPAPTFDVVVGAVREQLGAAKDVGRAVLRIAKSLRDGDNRLALPMQAPKSVLNQRITRSRRFATLRLELDRVKAVATRAGGTVNDVVLAVSGIALRRYLAEQNELPTRSLIAMLPVNVRPKDDPGGGNAVGSILASLATDLADPNAALAKVIDSTKTAKAQLQGMSKSAIIQYSGFAIAPLLLSFVPGAVGRLRPAFNVVISNVPGPDKPLYFRGWRLEAVYPLSIPFPGYGLNITVESYAGSLDFGFTGCRDTLPHLQRLAIYSGEAFEELARS